MLVKKLILVGYKRLMTNNINELVITLTSLYQLLLGTNGSGKSSVLKELGPLPAMISKAESSEFVLDGYKIIELEHRGHDYILTSKHDKGSKHSFIKDGEELNPGGTGQVQKELVKREFGITPAIWELLVGAKTFTAMSTNERREWITQLSQGNLEYAIEVYNNLKRNARNAEGALKHVQKRIASETAKLLELNNESDLEKRAEELHRELYTLMQERDPNLPPYRDVESRMNQRLTELEAVSRNIIELDLTQPEGYRFKSLDEVEEILTQCKNDYAVTEGMLKHYTQDYADLESTLSTFKSAGVESIEQMQEKLYQTQDERERIQKTLERFSVPFEPKEVRMATEEVLGPLTDILSELPDNTDRRFNRERLKECRDRIQEVQVLKDRVTNRRTQSEHRIEHMLQAKETNCPKCGYMWREGFSEHELKHHQDLVTEFTEKLAKIDEELERCRNYVEEAEEYIHIYGRYRSLVSAHPRLQPLWDYFLENNCLTHNPKSHLPLLHVWHRDMIKAVQVADLTQEIDHISAAIAMASEMGDTSLFDQRVKLLEESIEQANVRLGEIRGHIRILTRYRDAVKRVLVLDDRRETLGKHIVDDGELLVKCIRRKEMDYLISAHQNQLAEVNRKLSAKTTLEGIIADLVNSQESLSEEYEALKLLADELSPVDGLIADNLTGFIRCLVGSMNEIVESIWTQPLVILPCGLESGELDYKFPVRAGKAGQSPDIEKTSDGQTDIINFAFKLMAMVYLDLTDFPLHLDEFDRRLDEQHRTNAMQYVRMLIDAKRHTQLFMISHYASSHGSFANAEFCVLDGSNITVPQGHNRHVVLR